MRQKYIFFFLICFSCIPTLEKSPFEIASLLQINNRSSSPNLSYSGSPFYFVQNTAINKVTPTISGTMNTCLANPTLPQGLTLDNSTCEINGTPTTLQSPSSYTITATNSFGSANTTIDISIDLGIYHFSFASASLVESYGSGLTFTAVASPTLVNGKDGDINGGYSFDGSTQYLTIANPSGLPSGSNSRSFCAWVNPTTIPNASVIVSQGAASNASGFGLTLNSTYPASDVTLWSWGSNVTLTYTPKINT